MGTRSLVVAVAATAVAGLVVAAAGPAWALQPLSPSLGLDPNAPACASVRSGEPLVDQIGNRRIPWRCDTKHYDPYGDVATSERLRPDCTGAACDPWVDKAREVIIAYPETWNRSRAAYDLVVALHGTGDRDYTGQSDRTAIGLFTDNWARTSPSIFKNGTVTATARSQALRDLRTQAGGRVIFAALNSGYNDLEHNLRWELFQPTVDQTRRPPQVSLSADRMEDIRRLLTFVRQMKANNPGRIGKVYIVGFSNGAEQVMSLACFFPHQFDGFGMFDRRMTSELYEYCGRVGPGRVFGPRTRLYHDMTVHLTALAGRPTVSPRSLRELPKPIFLAGGTHSHAATYDRGNLTTGVALVRASGIADCATTPDSVNCQKDAWEATQLNDQIVVDDQAVPNNGTTLGALATTLNQRAGRALFPAIATDSDAAAHLKRFLDLLGMGRHHYFSGVSVNPTAANCGIAERGVACKRFADVASVCTNAKSDRTLHRVRRGGDQRMDMDVTGFVYTGGRAPLAYVEITGGAHYTQGRGHVCAAAGTTHDVDTATEFLKFVKTHVPGGNL